MTTTLSPTPPATADQQLEALLGRLRQQLGRLAYGTILLSIHDGRVVQMDVTERHRFRA